MKRNKIKKDYFGYYFISPFFIVYLIFGIYPVLTTFKLSFFKYDMNIPTDQFVGLKYILRALKDVNVWQGIWVALKFWFVGNLLVQITALMLAAIFTYLRIRGAHFFKSSFYLPSLVSTSVVATIFSLFIGYPDGTINQLLLKLGIIVKPQLFVYMKVVIFSLIVFLGWWMGFGGTTIIANAGMTSISPDLYEAAKIDGANFFQVFTKITIPLIWPVLTYMWLTGLIWGLQVFDIPFMITKSTAGGPDNIARTIVMYIYRHGLEVGNMGYAAGINIVFFLTIVILSFLMLFIMRKQGEQSKLAK